MCIRDRKWVVSAKRADFQEISRKFGVDPVIARLIRNREQITDEEIERYLHGRLSDLHSWRLLKGIGELLEILKGKIDQKKKIRIIGDYDIDGVCSLSLIHIYGRVFIWNRQFQKMRNLCK